MNNLDFKGRRIAGLWALLLFPIIGAAGALARYGVPYASPGTEASVPFRFAFSPGVLADLNENDARAAMLAWGKSIIADRGLDTNPDPQFVSSFDKLVEGFRERRLDAASMTTVEYFQLARTIKVDSILAAQIGGNISEEYVLLVHKESGINRIEDLRGRTLNLYRHPRTDLAPVWLDTLLAQSNLGTTGDFLGKLTPQDKLTRAVLPVFFRQADACLVHRRGFSVMSELNPQLSSQLRVLVQSPPYVPGLLCFRADYLPPSRSKLISALLDLHTSPSGRQILALFQCDRIELQTEACLESARELIARHDRLAGPARNAQKATSP